MRHELEQAMKKYLQFSSRVDFKVAGILNKLDGKREKAKVYFRIVPESQVSERYLSRAEKVLVFSNRILKLINIKIKWIEYAGSGEKKNFPGKEFIECDDVVKGFCDIVDNEIFIRHDIPLEDAKFTLAHELHHAWFHKEYGDQYSYEKDHAMWEQTANTFAAKILRQIRDVEQWRYPLPTFLGGNRGEYRN